MPRKPARYLRHTVTGVIVGWQDVYEGVPDLEEISEEEAIFAETGKRPAKRKAAAPKPKKAQKKPKPDMTTADGSSVAVKDFKEDEAPPDATEILAALDK